MRSLTFISGPPCSGKSVACEGLLANFPALELVEGDRFWNQNEGMAFDERVALTNAMILESLATITSPHLLLEWVPTSGTFCQGLRKVCEAHGRSFSHIVLYAEPDALRRRKMERDADEDAYLPAIDRHQYPEETLVLDTTRLSKSEVQAKCVDWLRGRL